MIVKAKKLKFGSCSCIDWLLLGLVIAQIYSVMWKICDLTILWVQSQVSFLFLHHTHLYFFLFFSFLKNYTWWPTTVCRDSNRITPLRNLKCLKPGLRWFLTTKLYVTLMYLLHICIFIYDKYYIYVTYM